MRSAFFIGIVVFLGVVGGGYCIGWYAQASRMKAGIEQAIANLHTHGITVTYQSIETSGFPRDVTVSLVNPRVQGRVDQLLKSIPAPPGKSQPFADLPSWQEDDALAGRITFSINALSSHYRSGVTGDLHHQSEIGGKTLVADIHRSSESACTVGLSRSGWFTSLWDFEAFLHRGNALRDLRLFDCASPGETVTGAQHETLIQTGPSRIYVTSAPSQGMEDLRIYFKGENGEVTPAGDAWITALTQSFGKNVPSNLALYGKQNIEINFSYAGPADAADSGKPLNVQLNPLSFTSQADTIIASLSLTDSGQSNPRQSHLAFRMGANFGAAYDAIQQTILRSAIQSMYADKNRMAADANNSNNRMPPVFLATLNKYTPDQMYAILSPAIPQLHALGQMTGNVDANFKGEPDFKTGDVALANLQLSATPYGLTGAGNAHIAAGAPPTGQLTLICAHCLQLVDDTTAYAGRVRTAFSYFNPAATAAAIDPKLVEGAKQLLGALAAKDASGNNFTYIIVSKGGAGATINGKGLPEVMQLYDQYIGAVLRQEAAAKAPPPAAPSPAAPSPH